ncbi:cell division initiation protein [Fructilactobacillus fructivorans]|nr:cell division initiation protein [Fructilactobacillus fructivorans]KRN43289.1 cell division initiation protein [Fructilactobacillus fructivorans]
MRRDIMTLTAQDIHDKKFSLKMRGYSIDEVNDFLDQLTKDYQILQDENEELKKSLKKTKKDLTYYDDLKNSLNQSILVAQEAADKVKKDAESEADEIKQNAQKQADSILSDTTDKSNQIMGATTKQAQSLSIATDDFRNSIKTFRQKMIGMLQSQLDFAKNEDWNKLLDSSNFDNYDEIQQAVKNLDKQALVSVNSSSNDDSAKDQDDQLIVESVSGPYTDPTVEIYPNDKLHK